MTRGVCEEGYLSYKKKKKTVKHLCSLCLQTRVRTSVYRLAVCQVSDTHKLSQCSQTALQGSPHHPQPTQHTTCMKHSRTFLSESEARPLGPEGQLLWGEAQRTGPCGTALSAGSPLYSVCCSFGKARPEFLPALPLETQHVQQSLLNR